MRRIGKVAVILGITACLGIALVACGSDDDKDEPAGGTPPAAASTSGAPTTPAGDGESGALNVAAKDFSFALDKSSVKKGSQVDVAFENQGSAPHTINFYTDEAYTKPIADAESGRVSGGGSKAFTFTAPAAGTAAFYRCEVHPAQMQGEITLN